MFLSVNWKSGQGKITGVLVASSNHFSPPSFVQIHVRRLFRTSLHLLSPQLGDFPNIGPPLENILRLGQDIAPILKRRERHPFPLTNRNKIMPLLCKQQIRFPCRAQIAQPIAGIQQGRLLAPWHLCNRLRIRPNGQTFIMPERAVVMVLDGPSTLPIQIIHWRLHYRHVCHHLKLPPVFFAQQMLQQRADNGHHARG